MTVRILAATSPGEVRIAVTQRGILLDYAIWRPGAPDGVGDLYIGRVTARVPAMAGAFIKLNGTEGFLPDSEGAAGLAKGDDVIVRITRAAEGGKGPRLTGRLVASEVPTTRGSSPSLLARGGGPLLELAQRHPEATVWADDAALVARMKAALPDRLRVSTCGFETDVEEQIQALAHQCIELPGGGRLHFHPTPALVAIDVDTGAAVAARQGKAAFHYAANQAVLPVLARQIRLRNLSGAIVVDFAGMPARRRSTLGAALRTALAEDPLCARLLGFTALGLAEIVRPRIRPPLHELLSGPHAAGLAALRQIAAEVSAYPHRMPALRASPAIIAALESDAEALSDLARRAGRPLMVRSDPNLLATMWAIESNDG